MFRNYLLVTFRNLWKNKVFTLINILGLGIALSVCIVAFFNHMFSHEFDRTHENFDQIYRITSFRDMEGREQEYGTVPSTLGLQIKNDIPGVLRSARVQRSRSPVKIGDNIFPAMVIYADPEFTEIFTLPLIHGTSGSLTETGNVLLNETMAKTLFGKDYAVGKAITIVNDRNSEFSFTVAGVFKDFPDNSSFRIDILVNYNNFLQMRETSDSDWKAFTTAVFIQVPDKSMLSSVNANLRNYIPVQNRAREDFKINRFSIIPLDEVGENTRTIWSSGLFPGLHPAALNAPPIMAIFILLIACFNFANTSIAIFSRRTKEIGLRKTFGGVRSQLVTQFMFETLIICLIAMLVGIALAEFLVPAYSSLWAYMSIELTFSKYLFFWVFLFLLLVLTGFIAGVYPAMYVSSFSPVQVLKGSSQFRPSGKLSALLLTMQFAISVAALIMGISFSKNAEYQRTLDLGYDRDKVIMVPLTPDLFENYKNEVLSDPKVLAADGTGNHIGWGYYRRPVKENQKQVEVDVLDIGPGYAQTMGLRLKAGRLFEKERESADRTNNSVIINQKLAGDFGWTDPVGKKITLYDTLTLNVIGMVDDFFNSGVWEEIEPTMLRLANPDQYNYLTVRTNKEDIPAVLESLERKWKNLSSNLIFEGRTQEDLLQEEKDINGSILKVNVFLSVVATILSLIGMFNMVSLDIIRRTKEVGIRKIQGASIPVIMYLISRKFMVVLLIASAMGCAGGYYLSLLMMDSIWDYFTGIGAGILISAVLIIVVATAVTLSVNITRAALKNPVDSLRYE